MDPSIVNFVKNSKEFSFENTDSDFIEKVIKDVNS